ncbi:MAG: type II toxin-antitoxin system HicB family antitoxin [Chloroflexi bacterium]|nr:type II toxin-antitoxin system HicB family antitoxin [Chloroflexota bacterium]MBU1747169.1 type II toxin-antitoxin system HicB family antitoxin [Chloroflexota bacterium]MBU1878713.1 type II toxin-antitoxin system HicB family antitoxin [Chloroflexota bacterium]
MSRTLQLTAVIEREEDGYVATCQELGIVSQGQTVEDARRNLLEAVEGFFEVASPSEIRRRLKKETYVMPIMPTVPTPSAKQAAR